MRQLGRRPASGRSRSGRASPGPEPRRVDSWTLAAVCDSLLALGAAALLCGLAGIGDDTAVAVKFAAIGAVIAAGACAARRRVVRPSRPAPRRVISGIGVLWAVLVGTGAAVYLLTGSLADLDGALLEASAGLTTTAVTVLEVGEASRSVLLWRAATSWVGGLVAILVSVVALPSALRVAALFGSKSRERGLDLAPSAAVGIRRVLALYSGFTAALALAFLAAGLPITEAVVVGLGTASTGGFSPRPDSLASYGAAAAAVAAAGMLAAGASIFVLWWIARGRVRPLLRSQELRTYAVLLAAVAAILFASGGAGPGEALFTAASVMSTTGYAVADWTVWPAVAVAALTIAAVTGSMLGSPGGGVKVLRVRLLLAYAARELRRQLYPHAVLLVRSDGRAVDDRTLDRAGSYQSTHIALVGAGAVMLGATGMSVTGSLWSSVSAVSNLGPAVGEIGVFGHLGGLERSSRAFLIPLMLAGQMAILPLLALLGFVLQWPRFALRRARRLGWRAFDRLEISRRHQARRSQARTARTGRQNSLGRRKRNDG